MSTQLPDKYNPAETETKWIEKWSQTGLYSWRKASREETYVVDTPPPTVSGSLHIGHVFSYTHTDVIVRYQRMRGKAIYYPMGWDDNGLPTERRVENYFGIRCNPGLPYDTAWKPVPAAHKGPRHEVSRQNFVEACAALTAEDEKAFKNLWTRLGLSVDWKEEYATIDNHCRRISQLSFLELVQKGLVYHSDSPSMWDVDFQTAVAQAELEDREVASAFYKLKFGIEGGGDFEIATTRPELLAACIGVVAHPSDTRYQKYFGKYAITPLFHARVPICAAEHADPEKGTGILMVCTFGDMMDVEWWRKTNSPLKQMISRQGRILNIVHGDPPFTSLNPEAANRAVSQLAGLTITEARKITVDLLGADGSAPDGAGKALIGEPEPIKHAVKFYEKGEKPVEFVPTRQWFVRILDFKDELIAQGRKINWHPPHMLLRYENWVAGLNQDWCYSRQRYSGVPFPVWYPVNADGETNFDKPIYAAAETFPVDPAIHTPPGYEEGMRNKPGGFRADPDIMDTWATSSLTPQIATHWRLNPERHQKLFPMDLRPQAHDIIRTWAFYTIVKAWFHDKEIPWKNVAISGFILDPDRKKMSKSKGNVVVPDKMLQDYSADAVRYWAARARLGTDAALDPRVFEIGRKLATKIFNASRFVLMQFDRIGEACDSFSVADIGEPLDLGVVEDLRRVIKTATDAFEQYDYASALQVAEDSFWRFCDYYLELVKVRSYAETDSPGRRSAFACLNWALRTYLRLFAPVLPYVCEEVWSWRYAAGSEKESIHVAAWPSIDEVAAVPKPAHERVLDAASEVISQIRGAKSVAKRGLKWPVTSVKVTGNAASCKALETVLSDVAHAANISDLQAFRLSEGAAPEQAMFQVDVELAAEAV